MVTIKRVQKGRKLASKRRWKARCRLGRWIPEWAIVEWQLGEQFAFEDGCVALDFYRVSKEAQTGRLL